MQNDYIRKRTIGKHLNLIEKGKIETYLRMGYKKKDIEKEIGVFERIIYR